MNNSNKVSEVSEILTNKAFNVAVGTKDMVKLNIEVTSLANKCFRKSVELGRLINKAHKVINATSGINLKQYCHATFSWSMDSSMGNRYSKIGVATDVQVETFEKLCEEEPKKWKLNILSFKTWIEGKDAKESTASATIFTMAYKGEDGNVSVRISDSGEVKTSNSKSEILDALAYLKKCYDEQCAKESAEATTSTIIGSGVKVSAEAIEKKALEQARLAEKRSEQVERESIEEKQFVAFYKSICKGLKFDMTEYKAWRRAQVLAYRAWFVASDENKAYLGAWLSKQAKAIK